jgi:hypothetical protein
MDPARDGCDEAGMPILLGRQQNAVSRSANLAAFSAYAYPEQASDLGARSALQGGISLDHGMGLFWRFCWGGPFLISAAQDGATESMIPGAAADDKSNNFKCLFAFFLAFFHVSKSCLSPHFF